MHWSFFAFKEFLIKICLLTLASHGQVTVVFTELLSSRCWSLKSLISWTCQKSPLGFVAIVFWDQGLVFGPEAALHLVSDNSGSHWILALYMSEKSSHCGFRPGLESSHLNHLQKHVTFYETKSGLFRSQRVWRKIIKNKTFPSKLRTRSFMKSSVAPPSELLLVNLWFFTLRNIIIFGWI